MIHSHASLFQFQPNVLHCLCYISYPSLTSLVIIQIQTDYLFSIQVRFKIQIKNIIPLNDNHPVPTMLSASITATVPLNLT